MSQFDAAATPLYAAFQNEPLLTEYTHIPAKISLEEKNAASDYGAAESVAMNMTVPDQIPMRQMNEILWKSIKGADSIMPPPVRAAFVHPIEEEEE